MTIQFLPGINVIVGSNGVGKSTLAAAIAELLSPDPNLIVPSLRARLRGSTTEGLVLSGDVEEILSIEDAQENRVSTRGSFAGDYYWLDPSTLANRCLHQISTDNNFGDLLEPVTPQQLEKDELEIASYLVGKNYTGIAISEISDYGGFERFPYFRATAAGVDYGSDGMGRGELSLLLTYWILRDLPRDSILILEEPETHVSPRSQDCLMNVIAKVSDEKGIWVIVTTHSPTVVARIPRDHVTLLARHDGPSQHIAKASKIDVALLLGGGVAYSGVLLVEDTCAKAFVLCLLDSLAPELLRQLEITVADSESAITSVMRKMPPTQKWLTLMGIYDGDMREKVDGADFRWPFTFLPGAASPERLLKSVVDGNPEAARQLAAELHQQPERIQIVLDLAAGVDHHDYFPRIAAGLATEVATVQRAFARVWLQSPGNLDSANILVDAIRNAANG